MNDRIAEALAEVVSALPSTEDRPGQRQFADTVAKAIETGQHLVIAAGTGTGKTLGYLVPAVVMGKKVVVATATKALQDQLATKDLPFLSEQLAQRVGLEVTWAVLKGRSNYVCLERLSELRADEQLELEGMTATTKAELARIARWADGSDSGDQAELPWAPTDRAWQAVSVGADECPGASRCPNGGPCFAERARARARDADVVVVNMHLYGLDVGSGHAILPEHEVVVFDEAHMLEDITSDTVGVAIGAGRANLLGAALRKVIMDSKGAATILDSGLLLREALRPLVGKRLPTPLDGEIASALLRMRQGVDEALGELRAVPPDVEETKQRTLRAQQLAGRLAEDIASALAGSDDTVAYVGGGPDHPRLEIAPLDVGPVLAAGVWESHTAVLTSATIPSSLPQRLGLDRADRSGDGAPAFTVVDVGSPFDYQRHALLYCAMHLPDPRSAGYAAATHDELAALITAAGGRTLALFTSWKAMDAAAEAVRARVEVPILTQRDLPKPALLSNFAADEATSVFATAGLFQGVDVPGRSLSLVVIDRIPFPRPDDPLLSARRELLGAEAFRQIDLPRAATMLAQATGRLIRNASDRGVVAVLDRRLGQAPYRWEIINALPPMRRTRHRAEVEEFLTEITRSDE